MATIQERFGSNATLSNSILTIDLTDYLNESLNNPNSLTTTDGDKIFTALVKKSVAWETALPVGTTTHNVSVAKSSFNFISLEERNSAMKRRYEYGVVVYESDLGASDPDPNNV